MKRTGGSLVRQALEDEGIELTFGIPGTHNIELYDALAESERVRPVLVTDEQGASFMADGAWRASGRMACVNVVPGAGLTHALSGIAEAWMDNVPMLVLGCGIRRDSGRAYQLHDIDQMALVEPVVKAAFRPLRGDEVYRCIREACRIARSGAPGPVFVEIPANLYMMLQDASDEDLSPPEAPAGLHAGRGPYPEPAVVDRVVELLGQWRRPLIYLGAGAAVAHERLVELAERLEAPVSTTFQGKGVFPETHPLWLWPGFGDAAPAFARRLAATCDGVLAIGCRFSEVGTGSYGLTLPGPLIHCDVDADVPGRNYPAEVAVHADAEAFVTALLERLDAPRDPDEGLRRAIAEGHAEVERAWEAETGGSRVTPYALLRGLQRALGPEAVYTADSGNGTFLAMEILRLEGPGHFLAPVDYSCMGYSVPAAVGARLACPDRPVVALAGDGAFLMTGLETLTSVAHGAGTMIFVLRDRELAQIAQFQGTALNRKVASELPDYQVEGFARALGAEYLRVDRDDDVEDAVRAAWDHAREGRTTLAHVEIDYGVRTYFTKGVVKTNLHRLPLGERLRYVSRALLRRVTG